MLVVGALFFFVGGGLVVGGAYLLLTGHLRSPAVWGITLVAGPLAVYAALEFVQMRWWSWVAVVALLVLLIVSALYRAAAARGGVPVAPLAEALLQGMALLYLVRPRVRRAFGL